MTTLVLHLWNEESGFIISAEMVLVCTIAVLAMSVGLSEVAFGINQELEDTGTAFGTVNQSFRFSGITGHNGSSSGSFFQDLIDFCDAAGDITGNQPTPEGTGSHGN
jgi:hypothetical protein